MAMDMNAAVKIAASVTGGATIDELKKSIDGVSSSVNSMKDRFSGLSGSIKGLAAAFGVIKLGEMIKDVIDAGEEMDKLSQKTGVSVEALSTFKAAAKLSEISLEDLGKAFVKFDLASSKAQTGNRELAKVFETVGISATQLRNAKTEDLVLKVANSFQKMQDGATKTRIAVDLFGKSGAQMIPVLNMGADAIEKMGVRMSTDFAQRAAQFNDNLKIIETKFKVITVTAVSELLPTLQEIANSFMKFDRVKSDNVIGFFDAIGEAARILTVSLYGAWKTLMVIGNTAIDFGKIVAGLKNDVMNWDFSGTKDKLADIQTFAKGQLDDFVKFGNDIMKNSFTFGMLNGKSVAEVREAQLEATKLAEEAKKIKPDPDNLNKKLEDELAAAKQWLIQQQQVIKARLLEMDAVDMTDVEYKKLLETKKLDAKLEEERTKKLEPAALEQWKRNIETIKQQTNAMLEQEEVFKRTADMFGYLSKAGAKQAMKGYLDDITDVAKQTKKVFETAFKGIEDALVEFTMTGKLNFRDLANSIIKDLIRIQVQQSIMKPLVGFLNGIMGNVFSTGGPVEAKIPTQANGGVWEGGVQKFANGGVVTSPTLFPMATGAGLMGEAGPEAIMPLKRTASGALGVVAQGGGTNNVTVNVAVSGEPATKADSQSAGALGNVIAKVVQAELVRQKRPGGLLFAGA